MDISANQPDSHPSAYSYFGCSQGVFSREIYIKKTKSFILKGIPVLNASAL